MTSPHHLPGAPGRDATAGAPGCVPEPSAPVPTVAGPDRPGLVLRPAGPEDVPEILAMIRELAEYERSAHEVAANEELIAALLFGGSTPAGGPAAFCHVVEVEPGAAAGAEVRPHLAAFALWFLNTSTWTGRHGIYLEDLYVRPQHRGLGLGRRLMSELARICLDRGYARLEWWVLDWNEPALDFYDSLGAQPMDEWTVHRMTGAALQALAGDPLRPRLPHEGSATVGSHHRLT